MTAYQWLQLLGLGGFSGALGQGARAIVRLKKLNDSASNDDRLATQVLDTSRLLTSLAIGFVAGAQAAISLIHDLANVSTQQILGLAASGMLGPISRIVCGHCTSARVPACRRRSRHPGRRQGPTRLRPLRLHGGRSARPVGVSRVRSQLQAQDGACRCDEPSQLREPL
jgi:hypothetical protein